MNEAAKIDLGTIEAPLDGRDTAHLRGDRIAGERYFSREFAQAEWDGMWTRIWQARWACPARTGCS